MAGLHLTAPVDRPATDRPAKLGWVIAQFDAMERAVGKIIGERTRASERRFDALEQRLDAFERQHALERRLDELERRLDGGKP